MTDKILKSSRSQPKEILNYSWDNLSHLERSALSPNESLSIIMATYRVTGKREELEEHDKKLKKHFAVLSESGYVHNRNSSKYRKYYEIEIPQEKEDHQ